MILLIPVVFILMYVVLLRPQQQRVRRQQQLISTIGVGDRVVTAGGLIGRVVETEDDRVWLELADEVVVEMLRMYVVRRLEEAAPDAGDLDDLDDADSGDAIGMDPEDGGGERDGTGADGDLHPPAAVAGDHSGDRSGAGSGSAATQTVHPDAAAPSDGPVGGAASATAPGTSGPAAAGSAGPEPDAH